VNGYLRLWLACPLLSACCSWRLYLCRSLGELSTHLAPQALFTQSSPVHDDTATSFPLSKHTGGGDTAPAFSGRCVYLQFMWEVGLLPSPVEFSSLCHSHKLSRSCLLGAPLLLPSPARPSLFIYSSRRDSLPPLFHTQGNPPSFLRVFVVLIAYYSVSHFSLGGGQSVQGAMLIWPRVVCESTVYCLAHLVRIFPNHLGVGDWRPGPFWFLHLT
jgi:hypothetical protein